MNSALDFLTPQWGNHSVLKVSSIMIIIDFSHFSSLKTRDMQSILLSHLSLAKPYGVLFFFPVVHERRDVVT